MEELLAIILIAETRKKGLEHTAVTLECMTEYKHFINHVNSVWAIYLKPGNDPDSNEERERALISQRTAFRNLIRAFEMTLSKFECEHTIPEEILNSIEKEK